MLIGSGTNGGRGRRRVFGKSRHENVIEVLFDGCYAELRDGNAQLCDEPIGVRNACRRRS
ncbi:MAG: hypothetical protein LW650_15360 [Planctomycetaceae bacterium]|nr:hypothetical protein [Planctomycetaceae bacterium]